MSDEKKRNENEKASSDLPNEDVKEYQQWGEKAEVYISNDKMAVRVVLKAPYDDIPVTFDEIVNAIKEKGVVFGIREDYIRRLADHPVYDTQIKVAEGKPASDGKEGELICHFNTDNTLVPKVLEDGSTDYKNMGFVNDAKEGSVLCDIVQPEIGEDGCTVFGVAIAATVPKAMPSPAGLNTQLSEDATQLIALCDGHVTLKDGKIQIKKVMNIDQVDQSTGNILFSGDVNINRDVRDGFSVRAGGSIVVKGVVESAVLIAGRDIIVSKGVHGKESLLSAGGIVRIGYIEMAQVKAKEAVFADAVLNAVIKCEGKVTLAGKKGCLIGGSCTALDLEANEIGNDANILTEVLVVDPELQNKERDELQAKIKECMSGLEKLAEAFKGAAALPMDKRASVVAQILELKRSSEAELREFNAKLSEMDAIEIDYKGRVTVHGNMHHNVTIDISGLVLRNQYRRPACTICRKKDKILFLTPTGKAL